MCLYGGVSLSAGCHIIITTPQLSLNYYFPSPQSSPPEDHLHGFLDSMGGSSHSSSDSSSDSSDDTIEDPSSITSTASSDSKESNEMVYTSGECGVCVLGIR